MNQNIDKIEKVKILIQKQKEEIDGLKVESESEKTKMETADAVEAIFRNTKNQLLEGAREIPSRICENWILVVCAIFYCLILWELYSNTT